MVIKSNSPLAGMARGYDQQPSSHSSGSVRRKFSPTIALAILTSVFVAGATFPSAEGSESFRESSANAASRQAISVLATTFNPDEKGDADGIANVIHNLVGKDPNAVGVAGLQELCKDERDNVKNELNSKSSQMWHDVHQLNDRGGGRPPWVCENGNSIIANRGFIKIGLVPFDRQHDEDSKNEETRGYVRATLQVDGVKIHVVSTHLATGSGPDRQAVRRAQVRQLVRDMRQEDLRGPKIVLGDFNATLDAPELRPLHKLLNDDGVSTPTTSNDIGPCPPRGEEQRKIDHIFVSKSITVRRALVPKLSDDDNPSDGHCPVVAHLRIPRR